MGFRVGGVDLEGLREATDGDGPCLLLAREDAEVIPGADVAGIDLEGLRVEGLGAPDVALLLPEEAEGEVDLGIVRHVAVGGLEIAAGDGVVLLVQRLDACIIIVERPEGGVGGRRGDAEGGGEARAGVGSAGTQRARLRKLQNSQSPYAPSSSSPGTAASR